MLYLSIIVGVQFALIVWLFCRSVDRRDWIDILRGSSNRHFDGIAHLETERRKHAESVRDAVAEHDTRIVSVNRRCDMIGESIEQIAAECQRCQDSNNACIKQLQDGHDELREAHNENFRKLEQAANDNAESIENLRKIISSKPSKRKARR